LEFKKQHWSRRPQAVDTILFIYFFNHFILSKLFDLNHFSYLYLHLIDCRSCKHGKHAKWTLNRYQV